MEDIDVDALLETMESPTSASDPGRKSTNAPQVCWAGSPWHEYATETGHSYYFNHITQETTWQRPVEPRRAQAEASTQRTASAGSAR